MRLAAALSRFSQVARYYSAGLVNLAFGFGLFALLVAIGLNIYVAQIASHFLGMAFNYLTYSRHVFQNAAPAKARFVLSYVVNYGLSLVALALAVRIIASPYIAGFVATVAVSVVNYFILKHMVFRRAIPEYGPDR